MTAYIALRELRIFGCLCAAFFVLHPGRPVSAAAGCSSSAAHAGPAIDLTPLTLHILQDTIVPVPGTDGLVHLAYAAQVTNLQSDPVAVTAVAPVDATRDFAPTGSNRVLDTAGKPIAGKVRLFGQPPPPAEAGDSAHYAGIVPAGGSGIMFFDITYPDTAAVPRLLSHKIVVTNVKTGAQSAGLTDPVPVSCDPPVVLRPPLVGHGWWNGNGCCETVNAHRAATLPANGTIKPPEQFAIDYVQIGKDGGCCTGPVGDVGSWPFYGAPVLAAAPGKVVEIADGEDEQVPGRPLVGVTVSNAAGNHIIQDIGGGRFILYAHFRRGSIPAGIAVGTMLTAGRQIGEVGNTGSSTAPHLHFQVMDRPSTLNAIGLPFVFDTQMLEGTVEQTPAEADRLYESGGRVTVRKSTAGPQTGKMPAEGQVFGYNLK